MKKSNVIPKKNYVTLLLIILGVLIILSLVVTIVLGIRNNRVQSSYLSRTIGEIQYDELNTAFVEMGSSAFLYIGYTNDSEVYDFETDIKDIIVNNSLQDNMLYYNATELMKENDYINKLNEKLSLSNNLKIDELPSILFIKDNQVLDIITSTKNRMINDGDFTQLLEKYEIIK